MATIKCDFYVERGYIVKWKRLLGESVVMGSFCPDGKDGKAQAEALRDKFQQSNDDERATVTTKPKRGAK